MEDTVTLQLGGTVPLRSFTAALDRLTRVLQDLSSQANARIEWVIAGLDYSSAIATVAGRPLDTSSESLVGRVVSDFADAGEAVAYGRSSIAPKTTIKLLREIARLVDEGEIDEVRFETADREAVIHERVLPVGERAIMPSKDRGSVIGRVQTLHGRGQLRFTVYDLLRDRAVSCYLRRGQEEIMRGVWGRLVEVEGVVSRDPVTDAPLTVRQVTSVTPFPDPEPGQWRAARGAVLSPDAPPAEDVIRKLRDGW